MAKTSTTHRCTECGWTTSRWVGRCGECQAWGSVAEAVGSVRSVSLAPPSAAARPITEVPLDEATAVPTGISELDRVLGRGIVPGAVILLAGEPGVGKSTLLLSVAHHWATGGRRTLYISAEESAAQVRLRASRTGAETDGLLLAAETDLGAILSHIETEAPSLLVLDSVQAVSATGSDGAAGGVAQVREVTQALVRVAKRRGLSVVLVGHVTKDGQVAGPRLLEHLVDVVLTFEGDRHNGLRLVRSTKNRYGPADEVGCFEMGQTGIREVTDPSRVFTTGHEEPVAGTCLTVTMEGRRPLLAEVQALVAPSAAPAPRRVTHGLESGKVAVILAVLERKAGIGLHNREVYASTVGGARTTDPAVDLAVALAVASAAHDVAFHRPVVALGEVGLSGELRRVPEAERRLAEARRLGVEVALVPVGTDADVPGLRIIEVPTVATALDLLGIRRARRPETGLRLVE